MILTFADKETERVWNGLRSRKLPAEIQDRALVVSGCFIVRGRWTIYAIRHPTGYTSSRATARVSTAFPLICSGVYASFGRMELLKVSKSSTTTGANWLHNPHAGELLVREFMVPLGLSVEQLAVAIEVDPALLRSVIEGRSVLGAELDLRLARYFRMSEGFFLGLQDDYELMEAKRALNGRLERIVPRAA